MDGAQSAFIGPVWRRALDGSAAPLAVVFAGCWLSNPTVGVMAGYLLAAVALTLAVTERSWAPVLRAFVAQNPRQASGIDVGDADHIARAQIIAKRLRVAKVAGQQR